MVKSWVHDFIITRTNHKHCQKSGHIDELSLQAGTGMVAVWRRVQPVLRLGFHGKYQPDGGGRKSLNICLEISRVICCFLGPWGVGFRCGFLILQTNGKEAFSVSLYYEGRTVASTAASPGFLWVYGFTLRYYLLLFQSLPGGNGDWVHLVRTEWFLHLGRGGSCGQLLGCLVPGKIILLRRAWFASGVESGFVRFGSWDSGMRRRLLFGTMLPFPSGLVGRCRNEARCDTRSTGARMPSPIADQAVKYTTEFEDKLLP
jgi:hypothetical protein